MTHAAHWHCAGAGCVCRGRQKVEMTAITMIATHANVSQNAASEGKGMPFHLRRACQLGQASVSPIHSATVSIIFARGPAGAKSWSAPSMVTILFGTRAWESTAA
jgi:hypothetical protein